MIGEFRNMTCGDESLVRAEISDDAGDECSVGGAERACCDDLNGE